MFMNFNLNDIFIIEVKLGNQIIQNIQLPSMFAKQQMSQLIQEISKEDRPMKVKCFIYEYNKSNKQIENSLIFRNTAYVNNFGEDG